jgi:serine/threonine protein kinase
MDHRTDEMPVLTVSLFDRAEIEGLVFAALDGSVALVPVSNVPDGAASVILELRSPDRPRSLMLAGELAGEPSEGMCPMFLKPVDSDNADELLDFLGRASLPGELPDDALAASSGRPEVRPVTPRPEIRVQSVPMGPQAAPNPGALRALTPRPQVRILTPRSSNEPGLVTRIEVTRASVEARTAERARSSPPEAAPRSPPREEVKAAVTLQSMTAPDPGPLSLPMIDVVAPSQLPLPPPPTVPRDRAETMPAAERPEIDAPPVSSPPPSVNLDPLLGRSLGGKYTILALIGAGGAGSVYRARHVMLQKDIAIKVMHPSLRKDPSFAERFHSEALAASKLDHPNVLRVLDFGEEPDGLLYIAMELLVGTELRALLWQGKMALERTLDIVCQVCAALSAASEVGIVHRDIKPENVVITSSRDDEGNTVDLVKVCDFGLATIAQADAETSGEHRATAFIAGTPEYMSPEQVRGEELDGRSDIYAVGVMLYEMIAGRPPFEGQSPIDILKAHLQKAVVPPSKHAMDVDPDVEAVVLRALAKDRQLRPGNAREMRAELRGVLERLRRPPSAVLTPEPPALPLDDPAAGFGELFVALTAAVARTTYYEREHPEFARSLVRVVSASRPPLSGRGEITIAQRDVRDSELQVQTGTGELFDLRRLLAVGVADAYGPRLMEVFGRRHVVSLTLKEGVSEADLADATELLSGPEVSADKLRLDFLSRGLRGVSILFSEEMLGKGRRLPWHVDLCISRLARDLRALPLLRGVTEEAMRSLRVQLVADVVRSLERAEDIRLLLENTDLVATSVQHVPELDSLDLRGVIVTVLRRPLAIATARVLLTAAAGSTPPPGPVEARAGASDPRGLGGSDPRGLGASDPRGLGGAIASGPGASDPRGLGGAIASGAGASDPRGASSGEARGPSAAGKALLGRFASRFLRDRSPESDELLRAMLHVRVVELSDLPQELQLAVAADQLAAEMAADPDLLFRRLSEAPDLTRYKEEIATASRALVALAKAGDARTVVSAVTGLVGIARGATPDDATREGLAAGALAALSDEATLAALAEALLFGPVPQREPARAVLAMLGAAAARALLAARVRGNGTEPFPRPRFVAALREVGRPALPAIAEHLSRIDPESAEANTEAGAAFAEDLLRSLPDAQDEALGRVVARFLRHQTPAVRRAAAAGLPGLLGPRAKPSLMHGLDDVDEGVRAASFAGLRSIRCVDEMVVSRVDQALNGGAPASDELRAGAAGALADVSESARTYAIAALSRTLRPKARSVLSLFKTPDDGDGLLVLVTVARVLLAIGGAEGRKEVESRAASSRGELKKALVGMLQTKG